MAQPTTFLYPNHRKCQLVAVKEGIFHPNLPSFRRMDMDSVAHKLSDEHSRTTTTCTKGDFNGATYTIFKPAPRTLNSLNITHAGREIMQHYGVPEELKKIQLDLTDYLSRPRRDPESKSTLPSINDQRFIGYGVRYVKPAISQSWNYTLRQEPSLDGNNQMPIPSNIYARHRDAFPKYRMNLANAVWRP